MKTGKKVRSSFLNSKLPFLKKGEASSFLVEASDDSHPSLNKKSKKGVNEDQFKEGVYLTVQAKINLSKRQLSLVAGLLLSQVCLEGANLNDIILSEYLLSRLLGQKSDPKFLKERRELEVALALQSLIFGFRDLTLENEKREVPEDVKVLIQSSQYVPNRRTTGSWKEKYSLGKFFKVRTVLIDTLLERSSYTHPYDSYCKGYGESHPSNHKRKTKPSPELDGEQVDVDKEGSICIPLLSARYYIHYQELEMKYLRKIR